MVDEGPSGRRRWPWGLIAASVAVAVVALWWWWPGLSGDPDDIDVHVVTAFDEVGSTEISESIDRRLREEGFLIERGRAPADWCDAADAVAESDSVGSRLVVWAPERGDCAADTAVERLVAVADGRRLVVVRLPGDDDELAAEFERRNVTVVDTERLLGEPGGSMECLWWEDCPEEGVVEPWIGGRLGPIGGERVARMIVTDVL